MDGEILDSIRAPQKAVKLFGQIGRFFGVRDWKAEDHGEEEVISKIGKRMGLKRYCPARITVDLSR